MNWSVILPFNTPTTKLTYANSVMHPSCKMPSTDAQAKGKHYHSHYISQRSLPGRTSVLNTTNIHSWETEILPSLLIHEVLPCTIYWCEGASLLKQCYVRGHLLSSVGEFTNPAKGSYNKCSHLSLSDIAVNKCDNPQLLRITTKQSLPQRSESLPRCY